MRNIKRVVQLRKLLSYFMLIATIWTGKIEVAMIVIPLVILNQFGAAWLSLGVE